MIGEVSTLLGRVPLSVHPTGLIGSLIQTLLIYPAYPILCQVGSKTICFLPAGLSRVRASGMGCGFWKTWRRLCPKPPGLWHVLFSKGPLGPSWDILGVQGQKHSLNFYSHLKACSDDLGPLGNALLGTPWHLFLEALEVAPLFCSQQNMQF